MRDYAKVAPQFWTGATGKALRTLGPEVQVIALYLLSCPSANMIGLYYLAIPTLCHETGSTFEGASKALRSLSEGSFAHYDPISEHVFVPEMAKYQIGERLSSKDNRHKAVLRELETLRKSPFFNDFVERYRAPFELESLMVGASVESPFEAPSKPLRSQKQEQKQEQKQKSRASRLPDGFGISDRVLKWATEHGLAGVIELHLEAFVSTCRAKGYEYIDWDEAFMNAVRKNWAKIEPPRQRTAGGALKVAV